MYTTLDIHYANTQIANAERRAEREGRQGREAGERCVRAGLLQLCHAREDATD
ncbi:MAG TPA: hypothetical protein VFD50_06705 [Thermoleophilia bacterium]|nr:hypothetical protein [Thermoleophilia bacterium]